MTELNFRNGDISSETQLCDMEATGFKVFNDSVHGHITLHPLLVKVVDTPEFQRLRNIKQLGVAHYVFPGAGHGRFEHSLGTCFLAGQMVEKLLSRDRNRGRTLLEEQQLSLCVQLAALCHDLGHGPYSHTWEAVTRQWGDPWNHEDASIMMFDHLVKQNNLEKAFDDCGISKSHRKVVKELIMGGPKQGECPLLPPRDGFLYEIVNNKRTGIDVDKWDYFMRDGLHLNLRITFDYRRLLEFCTVMDAGDGSETTHIAFRDKEILNLYDMYRVRSALHQTAYKHQVVINIELMLVDALRLAGNANHRINNSNRLLKEAYKEPAGLSQLTDHIFYDIFYSQSNELGDSRYLLGRIHSRHLYKFVCRVNINIPNSLPVTERQGHITEKRKQLEKELDSRFGPWQFRVGEFFLDLDHQKDPVSKVTFYQKRRGTNIIEKQSFENLRNQLHPFPFQLTKEATAQLLVFWILEDFIEEDLEEAKRVITTFIQNGT